MAYRTNRDLPLIAWGARFVLPAGSAALLVERLDGTRGDGFAAGSIAQLAALTGNSHDPKYRYVVLPSDAVDGEREDERAAVERVRAKDAAHPARVVHWAMTLDEARAASAAAGGSGYIDPADFRALPARAALCRTGDGHATVTRNDAAVTCPDCLARLVAAR